MTIGHYPSLRRAVQMSAGDCYNCGLLTKCLGFPLSLLRTTVPVFCPVGGQCKHYLLVTACHFRYLRVRSHLLCRLVLDENTVTSA